MGSIRVRFAPSPTGHLHVGGARTALFNWFFSRHERGCFVLRIEDTDVRRSSGELESGLLEDLEWLGIEWDEGPIVGGRHAPYRQSERIEVYREYADRLLETGKLYPCFCTDGELAAKRRGMMEEGKPPKYDGTCRGLTPGEREVRRGEGRPESLRFVVPSGEERCLQDMIRGDVVFPVDMVGDFVVIRSNGLPTYNFAAAVDDALMEITHVIRGEEHLSNTLRQMLVYEALGLNRPEFAHLPLILGRDRSKLSKRHGAPNIQDFRERGYPREPIVNYLAFLGWSPGSQKEIVTVDEIIDEFTIERVSRSPSIFDDIKLNWFSARHIRSGGSERYFEEASSYFPAELRKRHPRAKLREIFDIVSENLPCFSRLAEEAAPFVPGAPKMSSEARDLLRGTGKLLKTLGEELGACREWAAGEIKEAIKRSGRRCSVKGRDLFMPIRTALTGLMHGPELVRIIEIRGREDVLESLRDAAEGAGL